MQPLVTDRQECAICLSGSGDSVLVTTETCLYNCGEACKCQTVAHESCLSQWRNRHRRDDHDHAADEDTLLGSGVYAEDDGLGPRCTVCTIFLLGVIILLLYAHSAE